MSLMRESAPAAAAGSGVTGADVAVEDADAWKPRPVRSTMGENAASRSRSSRRTGVAFLAITRWRASLAARRPFRVVEAMKKSTTFAPAGHSALGVLTACRSTSIVR